MKTYEVAAAFTVEANSIAEVEDIVGDAIDTHNVDFGMNKYILIEGMTTEEREECDCEEYTTETRTDNDGDEYTVGQCTSCEREFSIE